MKNATIHTFDTTGDAYDACQYDENIKDGDVLYVESESVIGLAGCWPVAITELNGELHTTKQGHLMAYIYSEGMENGINTATKLARDIGARLVDEMKA